MVCTGAIRQENSFIFFITINSCGKISSLNPKFQQVPSLFLMRMVISVLRNWKQEIDERVTWIRTIIKEAGAKGIVFGSSGGKDSATVGAICKKATANVTGIIMPCNSIPQDKEHALMLANAFAIETVELNLVNPYHSLLEVIDKEGIELLDMAKANIKPRLRMITLYAYAQTKGYLVAGTGNLSETMMGYSTKWGDGACDFKPIADLTVSEVFELGHALGVPEAILSKKPSAGLWEGQTDEEEMGITYKAIDEYLLKGTGTSKDIQKITTAQRKSEHKRILPRVYPQ